MTLPNANNFSENNENTIYAINSLESGQYCAIIPKNTDGEVSMIVDINMKADFDALKNNNITKESLIEKLNKEYSSLKINYPSGIIVIPMIDISILTNAVNNNDKPKLFEETKKIGSITSELYKNLIELGIEKSRINQKIMIIEKTEIDTKFVDWLKEQMPNFVDGIKIDTKSENENTNNDPFANINPFQINNEPQEQIVEEPKVVEQQEKEEQNSNKIAPTEKLINNQNQAMEQSLNNQFESNTPEQTTTNETNNSSNNSVDTSNPTTIENNNQGSNVERKSAGFANLLIILVVLVGVTIASIELGKFLFNTFGS